MAAFVVALSVEHTWKEAAEILGNEDWWSGACVETSMQLRDELEKHLPQVAPVFVWGQFAASKQRVLLDHAWIEIEGGIILDMTAGQFLTGGSPLHLIMPGDWLAERYEEVQRDPAWARDTVPEGDGVGPGRDGTPSADPGTRWCIGGRAGPT